MSAKILVLDIETQRAVVETWGLFKQFVPIDCIQVPSRVLCFAAKWRDNDKIIFKSAWDEGSGFQVVAEDYYKMMKAAYDLLDEADIVVTWNGDRFDLQWLEAEFGRLGLGRPDPYKSLDLIKTHKRWFRQGLLSMKLDWTCRMWLKDKKVPHGGTDLWWDIRHGTRDEKREACKLMRTYNEKDTYLTSLVFEQYLPWININLSMYHAEDDELLHCTKCNSTNVHRRGVKYFATLSGAYQLYRCADCNSTSKGHRRHRMTTELRPV